MASHLDSDAIAQYLADNPHFFEEHAELFSRIKLTSPLAGRTVSLQERQMEVLREKVKGLEMQLANFVRIGHENDSITEKFYQWACSLLLARNDVDLPHVLIDGLRTTFSVPLATLRIWNVADDFAHTWFAAPVSVDAKIFSNGLHAPFCGANNDFEAASWLEDAASIKSIAMMPLRAPDAPEAFGLLILGSPEPDRFTADMATDFLSKIGETSSAALSCLLD
jgi:uncharacterized protein YigA (DUF484 family)